MIRSSTVITWIGLALRHIPTVAAAHWSGAPSLGIPVCSSGWRVPKWSQYYSWRIHTSLSRVAFTWWPGDWITSSMLTLPPPPAVHLPSRKRGRSAGAAGNMTPSTSSSFPFPPPVVTFLGPWPYGTWNQCSRHTCSEHYPSHSDRGHKSVGCPSDLCPPAAAPWSGLLCH